MATSNSGNVSTPVKTRKELDAVRGFLNIKDPVLFVPRNIGDRVSGIVANAALVASEFNGQARKDAAGQAKQHLQLYLVNDAGDRIVYNIQSQNQKASLQEGLSNAGITGLAAGDRFEQEYVGNDPAIREGMTEARVFTTTVTPAE